MLLRDILRKQVHPKEHLFRLATTGALQGYPMKLGTQPLGGVPGNRRLPS